MAEIEETNDELDENRRHASLTIMSDDLDPIAVTHALGITPFHAFKAGDKRGKKGYIWRYGLWSISTEGEVDSEELEQHIGALLNKVEPVKLQLATITSNPSVKARVFCFFGTDRMNDGIELSPQLMSRLGALNLQLGIDIYNSRL